MARVVSQAFPLGKAQGRSTSTRGTSTKVLHTNSVAGRRGDECGDLEKRAVAYVHLSLRLDRKIQAWKSGMEQSGPSISDYTCTRRPICLALCAIDGALMAGTISGMGHGGDRFPIVPRMLVSRVEYHG